jgi:hypothetical protein
MPKNGNAGENVNPASLVLHRHSGIDGTDGHGLFRSCPVMLFCGDLGPRVSNALFIFKVKTCVL